MEEATLRPATEHDLPRVREIVRGVLVEHGLAPDPTTTDRDLADIQASYRDPGGLFDVLEDAAGRIVGTVGLCPLDQNRCELRKMYLVPEARGRGLGKRLLEHALARARALGFSRVELETATVLVAARRLYESYGFRRIERAELASRCDQAYGLDLPQTEP